MYRIEEPPAEDRNAYHNVLAESNLQGHSAGFRTHAPLHKSVFRIAVGKQLSSGLL